MISFKEFCNEIKFAKDSKLNINNRPKLDDSYKIEYSSNKYSLVKNDEYFILIDKDKNILFYIAYHEGRNKKIILGSRENISSEKNLFYKVIYTLLFRGYTITEDFQHNILSINSIIKLINSNVIEVLYDGKDITSDIIDNKFDDNNINKTFSYRIKNHDNQHLIEKKFLVFENEDYFSMSDFFILNTKLK